MARVIFDTGLVISLTRRQPDLFPAIGNDDVVLSAVTIAELLAGIESDPNLDRRSQNQQSLERMLAFAPVEDYTYAVARHHAELLIHTRRTGRPRGGHDLIIAATARATDRTLLTTDAKASFDELPGVRCRVIPV